MADNFLERQYADYLEKKAAREKAKEVGMAEAAEGI